MEAEDEYRKKERVALVAIVVLASLALASLLVAFSYYCYIRNKVSKNLRNNASEHHFSLSFSLGNADAPENLECYHLLLLLKVLGFVCLL